MAGYAGLCGAMIEAAVKDARGRALVGQRPSEIVARRTAHGALRWLRGEQRGRLSVHLCCDGVGLDYDVLMERLERGNNQVRTGRAEGG